LVVGAAIGLVLGILVSVTTDVPLAPEIGLVLGALVGWVSRRVSTSPNALRYAPTAVRPRTRKESRMAGFLFKLETTDGRPAEPPTLSSAVPNWSPGDVIPLGSRSLVVVGKRDEDADGPPVLVVEEMARIEQQRRGLTAEAASPS
jgi:hypothetical protein